MTTTYHHDSPNTSSELPNDKPNSVPKPENQEPRLLDRVRNKIRLKHYSLRTEKAYVDWIVKYLRFYKDSQGNWRHPNDMGIVEIEAFLTHLAVNRNVAASTQNQALSALLFLYRDVLEIELPLVNAVRAKRPKRLPVVMSILATRVAENAMKVRSRKRFNKQSPKRA